MKPKVTTKRLMRAAGTGIGGVIGAIVLGGIIYFLVIKLRTMDRFRRYAVKETSSTWTPYRVLPAKRPHNFVKR